MGAGAGNIDTIEVGEIAGTEVASRVLLVGSLKETIRTKAVSVGRVVDKNPKKYLLVVIKKLLVV